MQDANLAWLDRSELIRPAPGDPGISCKATARALRLGELSILANLRPRAPVSCGFTERCVSTRDDLPATKQSNCTTGGLASIGGSGLGTDPGANPGSKNHCVPISGPIPNGYNARLKCIARLHLEHWNPWHDPIISGFYFPFSSVSSSRIIGLRSRAQRWRWTPSESPCLWHGG